MSSGWGGTVNWTTLAAALPSVDGFAAVSTAAPADLPGGQLIEAIITAEKLIGHPQAAQLTAIAELCLPGRGAAVAAMHDMLTGNAGTAAGDRRDPAVLAAELQEMSQDLAAAKIRRAARRARGGAVDLPVRAASQYSLKSLGDERVTRLVGMDVAQRAHPGQRTDLRDIGR